MKNVVVVFGGCLLVCASVLSGCNGAGTKNNVPTEQTPSVSVAAGTGKIAYVNIDTLEDQYVLLKSKRDDFKARQEKMESELQRSYQQMQSDAQEVQKKAEANTLTQAEYEAAQKRLYQMQKSLESRKQSLTEQLMKEQDDFNRDLKTRLDLFLEDYNKTRHFDFILSYSYAASTILFANKQLDITRDVVDGMNKAAKNEGDKKNK